MQKPADGRKRVVIEGVEPEIDAGRFPIKRITGDTVQVEADVFADGHDHVAARLLFRFHEIPTWTALPMQSMGKQGEYLVQMVWHRLGMARDRVFRVSWSEPVFTALQGAWVDITPAET